MVMKVLTVLLPFLFLARPLGSHSSKPLSIHVFVALCDNKHQNIYPVPEKLGDGDVPWTNLYWGARYGVKTFLLHHREWIFVKSEKINSIILERVIFRHRKKNVYLIADAYRGKEIKLAISTFLESTAGYYKRYEKIGLKKNIGLYGNAGITVYIGHNGLLDFSLPKYPKRRDSIKRKTIILSCYSRQKFYNPIKRTGAQPVLWARSRMSPEAYTLTAALHGILYHKSLKEIHLLASKSYSKYQKNSLKSSMRLLSSGW